MELKNLAVSIKITSAALIDSFWSERDSLKFICFID